MQARHSSVARGSPTPLNDVTFAVVDVETTGLIARTGDRICEVAVVVGREGRVVEEFNTLVDPERPISRGATAVNGITDAMVRSAPTFPAVAPALLRTLEGSVLVAHNAAFDMSFLSAELRASGFVPPTNPVVDTLALARRCFNFPSNRLGDVARSLGLQTRGLHRALADATITWQVLNRFLSDLRTHGVMTLESLLHTQGAITPLSGWRHIPPTMEWDGTQAPCPIEGVPPLMVEAVRWHAALRIRYRGNDGQQSERVVQPRKITLREQTTYLVAYCYLRHEERTFRMDRIVALDFDQAR